MWFFKKKKIITPSQMPEGGYKITEISDWILNRIQIQYYGCSIQQLMFRIKYFLIYFKKKWNVDLFFNKIIELDNGYYYNKEIYQKYNRYNKEHIISKRDISFIKEEIKTYIFIKKKFPEPNIDTLTLDRLEEAWQAYRKLMSEK